MNKLFDLNSPFMQALSRLTDLVFLSFLWFVCCLPVITIGPATAAMYFVAMKLARKEEVKIGTTFFQSFKVNFKQGIVLNLIFIAVGAVLAADLFYFSFGEGGSGTSITFIQAAFLAIGIWALCVMFYAYPMQAQFYNPIRRTLKNAMILSMQKPINTVIVFILNMFPLIFAYITVKLTSSLELLWRTAPIWVLLAPGALAYLCGKRFAKLFDPFLQPADSSKTAEETEDEE